MIVLSNMGLVKWDQISDPFSHQQLASNFDAIDAHDHTPGKGKPIPAGGLAPLSVTSSNLQDNVFTAEKITNGAITTEKLANQSVTNGKLSSPNHGAYRLVNSFSSYITGTSVATYTFNPETGTLISGNTTTANATPLGFTYILGSDYAVSGMTTYYQVTVHLFTNGTAPGCTFTFGLSQVSSVGGTAGNLGITPLSPLAGSTCVFTTPAKNTSYTSLVSNSVVTTPSTDFVASSQFLVPTVAVSGASQAAGSNISVHYSLRYRHV